MDYIKRVGLLPLGENPLTFGDDPHRKGPVSHAFQRVGSGDRKGKTPVSGFQFVRFLRVSALQSHHFIQLRPVIMGETYK
jgi:hypothetical protein